MVESRRYQRLKEMAQKKPEKIVGKIETISDKEPTYEAMNGNRGSEQSTLSKDDEVKRSE